MCRPILGIWIFGTVWAVLLVKVKFRKLSKTMDSGGEDQGLGGQTAQQHQLFLPVRLAEILIK